MKKVMEHISIMENMDNSLDMIVMKGERNHEKRNDQSIISI